MVRIIFENGEIMECNNVNKIYIENDEVSIETKQFRDIITDLKESVAEKLGVKDYVEHLE